MSECCPIGLRLRLVDLEREPGGGLMVRPTKEPLRIKEPGGGLMVRPTKEPLRVKEPGGGLMVRPIKELRSRLVDLQIVFTCGEKAGGLMLQPIKELSVVSG